jgi:hypothetical protein
MLRTNHGLSRLAMRPASSRRGLNSGWPGSAFFLSGFTFHKASPASAGIGTSSPKGTRGPIWPFTPVSTETKSYFAASAPSLSQAVLRSPAGFSSFAFCHATKSPLKSACL